MKQTSILAAAAACLVLTIPAQAAGLSFRTLESVCEQIVPTDQDPGNAALCGASLVEAIAASDPEAAALIEAGLAALDDSSERLHGEPFAELDFATQRDVLEQVEAGRAPGNLWLRPLFKLFVERSPELLIASPGSPRFT